MSFNLCGLLKYLSELFHIKHDGMVMCQEEMGTVSNFDVYSGIFLLPKYVTEFRY